MSQEEQDKEVKEAVKNFFVDPRVAQRVVTLVTTKRPDGWSHRSTATYYTETYALEIKESIDYMISTGEDIVFRFETWCNSKTGYSVKTLYARINQSIRYLIDFLDTNGQYVKWFRSKKIKNTGDSWTISFDKTLSAYAQGGLKPEFALPRQEIPNWERELYEWLESSKSGTFSKTGLMLSKEKMLEIKTMLDKVSGIMKEINYSTIKIVRYRD
jgi:hypothetical protein